MYYSVYNSTISSSVKPISWSVSSRSIKSITWILECANFTKFSVVQDCPEGPAMGTYGRFFARDITLWHCHLHCTTSITSYCVVLSSHIVYHSVRILQLYLNRLLTKQYHWTMSHYLCYTAVARYIRNFSTDSFTLLWPHHITIFTCITLLH